MGEPKFFGGMRLNDPPVPAMPETPITGPQPGKYVGRILIEVWELDEPSKGDGLAFNVEKVDTRDIRVIDDFLRDTIARLYARLERQERPS